jgi:hypothetical protein
MYSTVRTIMGWYSTNLCIVRAMRYDISYGLYDTTYVRCTISVSRLKTGAITVRRDRNSGRAIHARPSNVVPARNPVLVPDDRNLWFWSPEPGILAETVN